MRSTCRWILRRRDRRDSGETSVRSAFQRAAFVLALILLRSFIGPIPRLMFAKALVRSTFGDVAFGLQTGRLPATLVACQKPGDGRVAESWGFAVKDPSMRLSRTRLFRKVTRAICVAPPRNESSALVAEGKRAFIASNQSHPARSERGLRCVRQVNKTRRNCCRKPASGSVQTEAGQPADLGTHVAMTP